MDGMFTLTASDGFELSAYRSSPFGTSRGGLVVVQEIFGINSHIRSVCDSYAEAGYHVIAPALFDRHQRDVDLGYSADDIAKGRVLKGKASNDLALTDIAAARDEAAQAGKVGIVGYCWGGLITWLSASRLPGFACAIAYYGGGMTEALGETPRCPVMAHFGEWDQSIPIAGVDKLKAAHPDIEVFIYAADHGFNCDQRASYDPGSANLARERSLEFLRTHVG
jgi:carboxymethylenebutenolidase